MKRALLLLVMLVALVCAAPASASHSDPPGECDVNLSAAQPYNLEDHVNDDVSPGSTNIPHYKADDGVAVICLLSGTHQDSTPRTGTTNFDAASLKVRQAPGQSSVPVIVGRLSIDEGPVSFYDLKLDGFNQRQQVTTGGNLVRWTTEVSPLVAASNVSFWYMDISNQLLDGGGDDGGGGICINGTNQPTPAVSNLGVYLSRIHHCGDPYRTEQFGQEEGDPGARSDIHDHGIYANYITNASVTDNYIYSNVARGISFHYHGDDWYVSRNVIDNNGHEGAHYAHDNDPQPATMSNDVTNNLITNSGWGYNIGVGTESDLTNDFTGSDVTLNCLYDANDGSPPRDVSSALNRNIDSDLAAGGANVSSNSEFTAGGSVVPYGSGYDPEAGVFPLSSSLPSSCTDNDPYFGTPGPRTGLSS